MNDVMGIRLDQAEVVELWEKTEGWVTALRLAALSMRHQEDLSWASGQAARRKPLSARLPDG